MKATVRAALIGMALLTGMCDDSSPPPDPGCAHCCACRCVDNTITIDATDRCLDCGDECLDICDRYGGGGGDDSGPCDD